MAKKRQRTNYDNRQQTEAMGGGDRIPRSVHFFDPRCPVKKQMFSPGGKASPIVFKPIPPLDYDDAENFTPGRSGTERSAFYEWYVVHYGVQWAGYNDKSAGKDYRTSFFLDDPRRADDKEYIHDNPYRELYWKGSKAVEAGKLPGAKFDAAAWNGLFKKNPDPGDMTIDKPKQLIVVQAVIARAGQNETKGGKTYVNDFLSEREVAMGLMPEDELPVMVLSSSASCMADLFNQEADPEVLLKRRQKFFENPKNKGRQEPAWFGYQYGDPIGQLGKGPNGGQVFVNGKVYYLFNPKQHKPKPEVRKTSTFPEGSEAADIQGLEAAVINQWVHPTTGHVFKGGYTEAELNVLRKKAQFFHPAPDDSEPGLLYFPSHEEQALMLANAYKPVRKFLFHVWAQDRKAWFTKELEGILLNRVAVQAPGMPQDEEDEVSGEEGFGEEEEQYEGDEEVGDEEVGDEEVGDEDVEEYAEGDEEEYAEGDEEEETYAEGDEEEASDEEEETYAEGDEEEYDDSEGDEETYAEGDEEEEAEEADDSEDDDQQYAEGDEEEYDEDYVGEGADTEGEDEESEYLDTEGYDDSEGDEEEAAEPEAEEEAGDDESYDEESYDEEPAPAPKPTGKKRDPQAEAKARRAQLDAMSKPQKEAQNRASVRPSRPQGGPNMTKKAATKKAAPSAAPKKGVVKKSAPPAAAPKKGVAKKAAPAAAPKKGVAKKAAPAAAPKKGVVKKSAPPAPAKKGVKKR